MKKILISLLVLPCLLIIGGCTNRNIPTEKIEQSYMEKDGLYYFDNIPKGIKYTKSGERPDEKTKTDLNNISDFMVRDGEVLSGDYSSHTCQATNKDPIVINLLSAVCPPNIEGCGAGRRAILCGNQYLIEIYSSGTGPVLFGPFKL